jgi:hypothetical protein
MPFAFRRAVLILVLLGPVRLARAEEASAIEADTAAHTRLEPRPAPTFPDENARAWQVGLLRPDRMRHVSLAFALGLSIGLASQSPSAAVIGSLTLGVAKELWDLRAGTGFDVVDLTADAVGAAGAGAVTRALEP